VNGTRRWRTAFATSIGTSHAKTGTPCQDAGRCAVVEAADGEEVLLIAVSDGAGTAKRSDVGSSMAVNHFLERFGEAAEKGSDLQVIDEDFVRRWFADVRSDIADQAIAEDADLADYSCTMLGVIVGKREAVSIQIGDGAIVVSTEEPGDYTWVFWPQHGEYANSTYFLTQPGAEAALQLERGPAVDEVAVFSDGIERLVLDMANKQVHSPAFRPIFEWLSGTEPDQGSAPSSALVAYLGSDHVNRRTDDDKTLVMATRAAPPGKA